MGVEKIMLYKIHAAALRVCLRLIFAIALTAECFNGADGATSPVVASKAYVDSAITSVVVGSKLQADWNQANAASADFIKNKPHVPLSQSTHITNAVVGNSIQVQIDGFVFKSTKQTNANHWNMRIVNNTGAAVNVVTKAMQHWNNTTSSFGADVTLANGAEMNPDADNGDIGYGNGKDIFIVNMFDITNMRAYRTTLYVYVNKAVLVAERMH